MLDNLKEYRIILASHSPRRRQLLRELGVEFTEISAKVDETVPEGMTPEEAATYISEKKADHFMEFLDDGRTILITADTLVIVDGKVIGKPEGKEGAREMLRLLSGKMHRVVTGVTVRSKSKNISFTDLTDVYFSKLTDEEIGYYLENYQPYDKAGAYGIQEWIGFIGINRIDGSYFNVMGLPVQRLYEELRRF